MDCEKLSPDALKIFNEIKKYYPPDPWGKPQWKKDGTVMELAVLLKELNFQIEIMDLVEL